MRYRCFAAISAVFFFLIAGQFFFQVFSDSGSCYAQVSKLTSMKLSDSASIQKELQKAGINLTADEIRKGKEALDKKEKSGSTEKGSRNSLSEGSEYKMENATVVETPREISLFNRTRKIGQYQDISSDLKPFGYDFFRGTSFKVLTEQKDIPVPMNYVIGPGDQVNILLWGRMSGQFSLTVDRDGKITIPEIGPIKVAGLTFDQMSKLLIEKTGQIVGINIDISMGSTRTIPIFVLGDVERPGTYTIGALATITDGLMMAGGPSAIGSMRRVELRRGGKNITHYDLYDLFLRGDKSKDAVLQSGDVVFVPVTGPLVGVAGNVKRPAIYELRDKFDLQHVLDLAGGVLPSAYTQQMQVERIVKNEKQIVIDINDKTLEMTRNFLIQDADLIKVFSIVDADKNAVYLRGNVKRPGKYAFQPGLKIKDLIRKTDDLDKETFFDYALIKRENMPNREIVLLPLNLGKLLFQDDQTFNYELAPKDQIFIFNKSLFEDKAFITIEGEIRGGLDLISEYMAPSAKKDFETAGKDMGRGRSNAERPQQDSSRNKQVSDPSSQDFLRDKLAAERPAQDSASGRQTADQSLQDPSRYKQGVERSERFTQNPDREKQNAELQKQVLEELDQIKGLLSKEEKNYIFISKIEDIEEEIKAGNRLTSGAINYLQIELERIGQPEISTRLKRLEKKAQIVCKLDLDGNIKVRDAILQAGGLTSNASMENGEIIRKHAKNEFRTAYFNVTGAMADDPRDNLILQDGDRIIIHSIWEKNPRKSVFIAGDVTNPGKYQFTDDMTVRDLVFKAGNVLESAYLDEAEITSVKILDGKLGQLTHKVINLRKALAGDPAHNVILAPQDRLLVKQIADFQKVRVVTVSGQVSFPGKYPFRKGEKLSDLIERAGGFTPYAYLRGAFFTRERVREMQQKSMQDMSDRLERELLSAGVEQIALSASKDEVAAKQAEIEQKKQFIEGLRKTKATGRMTVFVTDPKTLKNSEFDFELEDGDKLNIPEKNSVVNVLGAVMSQGSHLYSGRLDFQDYIDATGGYSNYADQDNVFILKVDGSARKVSKNFIGWSASRSRWEMTAYGGDIKQVEPGDTIVVPEKMDRIAWFREIKDFTTILMNIAVAAGVVVALF